MTLTDELTTKFRFWLSRFFYIKYPVRKYTRWKTTI